MADEEDDAGMGVGVNDRTNGFEDELEVDACDVAELTEKLLSVLDWRDFRRKGID